MHHKEKPLSFLLIYISTSFMILSFSRKPPFMEPDHTAISELP